MHLAQLVEIVSVYCLYIPNDKMPQPLTKAPLAEICLWWKSFMHTSVPLEKYTKELNDIWHGWVQERVLDSAISRMRGAVDPLDGKVMDVVGVCDKKVAAEEKEVGEAI
ncbi:hypothetical protein HK097_003514, partial [Rhizophlyctis rosea]